MQKHNSELEESEESEEEEDYDQENYNHFVKYQDPDSESERSFERERQNMKNKYDDDEFDGESDFEDSEDLEEPEEDNNQQDNIISAAEAEAEAESTEDSKAKKAAKKAQKNNSQKDENLALVEKVLKEKNKKKEDKQSNKNSNDNVNNNGDNKSKNSGELVSNHCEIYVDNLPFNKNEIEIKNFFAKINKNVVFVKLLKDQNNRSKGRAFIKFVTYNDALSVINEGDITMNSRKLRISIVDKEKKYTKNDTSKGDANNNSNSNNSNKKNLQNQKTEKKQNQPSCDLALNSDKLMTSQGYNQRSQSNPNNTSNTIFVKNLPATVDEAKLKRLFKKFGKIENVRLLKNKDGSIKNFGYIDFQENTSTDAAIKSTALKLDNNDLVIEKAKSSFNQNVYNDSNTLAKKRKREQAEKQKKREEEKRSREAQAEAQAEA